MAKRKPNWNGANHGFEEKLCQTAGKLRNNIDAAEYKYVVLNPIPLKYISDAFKDQHQFLTRESSLKADPEEYRAEKVFWILPDTREDYQQRNSMMQRNTWRL